ncbi:LLM class F420-dependent oxidoreductase [Phenylobacterium sp. LjRoot225]|uniref:LLM class F420-dependent oxidoreductase n=1 Tax=Phenylobacterium sp. LjRoot225 TaxID=3342285 RepID=UPI003ED137FD
MKINVTMPFDRTDAPEEFVRPEAVAEVSAVLDRTGFNAALVTDHPCPTGRWLEAGGHHAQDPFVMLSLIAAHTKRVRLQTGILVLPYRNPFITARSIASLDVFSGGRVTLSVGAGYLKGEYKALGADFDSRNDIMDEYILAMKAAWTNEEFTFKGSGYEALGNRIVPLPLQKPHPPIYIGGNSKRAIRRAVELADGWNPFFTPAAISSTSRTTAMTDEMDLATGIDYMRAHCEKIGRETPPEIVLASINQTGEDTSPQYLIDKLSGYAELGVSTAATNFHVSTRAEWIDRAERFSAEVISKLG